MDERECTIALSLLTEPGNRAITHQLAENTASAVLERLLDDADTSPEAVVARERLANREPLSLVDQALSIAAACGARAVTRADGDWPGRVDDLAEMFDESDVYTGPPICLWVRGAADLPQATQRTVALVGARNCTSYGTYSATELAYGLARHGWTVVSGGAYGIDAAAHRGALAGGGPTICIVASGVDHAYPAAHADLFDRIAENGLLLSEWPPGSTPRRYRFLVRNRVIAALSMGTVVVEAGIRSGARQTARITADLDRTVMVVPGPITSQASAGVHQLARGPAPVRLVTRAAEIIEDLSPAGSTCEPPPPSVSRAGDRLSPNAARVLDSVPLRDPATCARIAAQAGVTVAEARQILPGLVNRRFIEEHEGRYRVATEFPPRSGDNDAR